MLSKMNIDILIHARWIIPVEPEDTVYENYALAVKNDKIVALLGSKDAKRKFKKGIQQFSLARE